MTTKLMIGTPMYGGVCTAHYAFSNINLIRIAEKAKVEVNYQFITTESLITRARNDLVSTFLDSNCTHLMFIDADIQFNPEDIIKLLDYDLDVVCGGYPSKMIDWEFIHRAASNGVPASELPSYASPYIYNRAPETTDLNTPLVEVVEAGTGFMMIKRSVFEKLGDHVPSYTTNKFNGYGKQVKEFFATSIRDDILLSEDYHFCRKWRDIGGKVFVDQSIQLNHIGSYVFQSSPNHWIS